MWIPDKVLDVSKELVNRTNSPAGWPWDRQYLSVVRQLEEEKRWPYVAAFRKLAEELQLIKTYTTGQPVVLSTQSVPPVWQENFKWG